MRRTTSVLDSSYIGLPYWTVWQAPKNIGWVPRPFAAERPLPALHLLLCQSRAAMMDGVIRSAFAPHRRFSPPPDQLPHPCSPGDWWQKRIALSSRGRVFTLALVFSCISPAAGIPTFAVNHRSLWTFLLLYAWNTLVCYREHKLGFCPCSSSLIKVKASIYIYIHFHSCTCRNGPVVVILCISPLNRCAS